MLKSDQIGNVNVNQLKAEAASLKSGLGAIGWATLEMFKRGGMPADEIKQIHEKMNEYFAKPPNDV